MGDGLTEKLVLIAGSASRTASGEKIQRGHAFVRELVGVILKRGAGLIAFASGEPETEEGIPLIFDWTVVREVDILNPEPLTGPRLVVVTSNKARTTKMNDDQRALLARLSGRGIVDVVMVPDDVHTGGNIGDEQTSRACAMVAIGGGKGVADRARKLQRRGIPVLPFDLQIGGSSKDGEGAVGLHKAMLEEPGRFFPHTAGALKRSVLGLSLDAPVMALAELAEASVAMIEDEVTEATETGPVDVLLLTALPVELEAMLEALGCSRSPTGRGSSGINYWRAKVDGVSRSHAVAVVSFGAAGNVDAAAVTSAVIAEHRPRAVMMVGIAAGMREKCRLGEVVISERVVAYEGVALLTGPEGPRRVSRPETYRTSASILQDLTAYLANSDELVLRLSRLYEAAALAYPTDAGEAKPARWPSPRLATIGSGEKLLRDPEKFRGLREDVHGKIEVCEMEGAGVATACFRAGVAHAIVRGISDYGDDLKNDAFHRLAARGAAIVAVDFVANALR